MGLIQAAINTVTGSLKDQIQDVVEPYNMGEQTVFTRGLVKSKSIWRTENDIISNGSVIHVYENQFMILTDGGKIVDYTAEPGYFVVDNSSMPSLFQGEFKESLKEAWERFKFGGGTPQSQKVYYINLQEIRGIKFGTRNPINYFDNFYNAELFLRANGSYSIKVVNPLLFYANTVPRNAVHLEVSDINEQFRNEFMEALQAAINNMSADGVRISYVASRGTELSKYLADVLDDSWRENRGVEVVSVGIGSISYDEESQKLINMRNQGAMMQDATVREGYVQSAVASGLQAAGSNTAGAGAAYVGMGMGMNAAGNFMGAASQTNFAQMQMNQAQSAAAAPAADGWTCECGAVNTGKFCTECGKARPAAPDTWTCECGAVNTGKFCPECGKARPEPDTWMCECGAENAGKFCTECGRPRPEA